MIFRMGWEETQLELGSLVGRPVTISLARGSEDPHHLVSACGILSIAAGVSADMVPILIADETLCVRRDHFVKMSLSPWGKLLITLSDRRLLAIEPRDVSRIEVAERAVEALLQSPPGQARTASLRQWEGIAEAHLWIDAHGEDGERWQCALDAVRTSLAEPGGDR